MVLTRPVAAAAQDPATPPAAVEDPTIGIEELQIRLVPMTKDELAEVAATWLVLVKNKTSEVLDAQLTILSSDGDEREAARERLQELVDERHQLFDKSGIVIDARERKGAAEEAIGEYRAYRGAIVAGEARASDFRDPSGKLVDGSGWWVVNGLFSPG